MTFQTSLGRIVAVGVFLAGAGCSHRLPAIVPIEGMVTVDGKPLPNAAITFIPQLDHFGAESNSTAVSDENGRFSLVCASGNVPGAVEGEHIVLVTESALPDDLRKSQNGAAIDRYRAKLGNRPIPSQYSSVSQSPLRITVKAGQGVIALELAR